MSKHSFKAKWYNPDNSPPSPNQISVRLPILSSARISAICDMFPNKTKNQILNDLIIQSLETFMGELESTKGKEIHIDEDGIHYEDIGERGRFFALTKKHLEQLQKETKTEDKIKIGNPIIIEHPDDK